MYSYYYVDVFLFRCMFYVLFVCKCVLYYCHRVATQLQLNTYIVYHIKYITIRKIPHVRLYLLHVSLHFYPADVTVSLFPISVTLHPGQPSLPPL
jgi:hypothetical protein